MVVAQCPFVLDFLESSVDVSVVSMVPDLLETGTDVGMVSWY